MKKLFLIAMMTMVVITLMHAVTPTQAAKIFNQIDKFSTMSPSSKTLQNSVPLENSMNYSWNDNLWNENENLELFYQNNRLTELFCYGYQNNNWNIDYQAEITYTNAGCCSEQIIYSHTECYPDQLIPILKKKVCYYHDNPISIVIYSNLWDSPDAEWYPISSNYFEYDSNNILISHNRTDFFMENNLYAYFRSSFGYDNFGRINIITSESSSDSISWLYNEKTSYSYLQNDVSNYSDFFQYYMKNLFYDLKQIHYPVLFSEILYKSYDNNNWINTRKVLYFYNSDFQPVSILISDMNGNTAINNSKIINTFNTNNYVSESITQIWENNNWVNSEKSINTYLPTANQDQTVKPQLNVTAFPNPFKNSTHLTIKDEFHLPPYVAVYNLRGQKITTISTKNINHLTWDGRNDKGQKVAAGIYYITIKVGDQILTKPITLIK